jgi:hypothetical protein
MHLAVFPVLPELPRLVVQFHYVLKSPWRVPVAAQARELGVSRTEYWRLLAIAEVACDVALQVMERLQRPSGLSAKPLNGH